MKLATSTIESLLGAADALASDTADEHRYVQLRRQLERCLKRHDRKGELRARILAVTPERFRELSRRHSFDQLIRQSGFRDIRSFAFALRAKLKDELHIRGWSDARIARRLRTRQRHLVPAF